MEQHTGFAELLRRRIDQAAIAPRRLEPGECRTTGGRAMPTLPCVSSFLRRRAPAQGAGPRRILEGDLPGRPDARAPAPFTTRAGIPERHQAKGLPRRQAPVPGTHRPGLAAHRRRAGGGDLRHRTGDPPEDLLCLRGPVEPSSHEDAGLLPPVRDRAGRERRPPR